LASTIEGEVVTVPLGDCQRKLTTLWLVALIPAFLAMVGRTLFGPVDYQQMWEWFLPSTMPTLILIIGTRAGIATKRIRARGVDPGFFKLALALSVVYLLLIDMVVVSEPFLKSPTINVVRQSSLFLAPLQGLVAACIGVFFASSK
jgi:hypothetical protein